MIAACQLYKNTLVHKSSVSNPTELFSSIFILQYRASTNRARLPNLDRFEQDSRPMNSSQDLTAVIYKLMNKGYEEVITVSGC